MVQHLMPNVGFGWAVRTCAFLIMGMLIFANLTITSNWEHKPQTFDIMSYLRPVREANFCIMAASCFFLYCKWACPSTIGSSELTLMQGACLCRSTTL